MSSPNHRTEEEARPSLHCLEGDTAPSELVECFGLLSRLPAKAAELLPELIATRLDAIPEDQRDARLARIARRADLDVDATRAAMHGLGVVFRAAAASNVDRPRLEHDLGQLGASSAWTEAALAAYGECVGPLRDELVRATIAAHGPVLTGAEWRIDTLGSSSRGKALNVPVAMVTFHYQDGRETKRLTLQMLPEAVNGLRELCDHLLTR